VAAAQMMPDVSHLDPGAARRVLMTASCRDSDALPRVANAGQVLLHAGRPVQVMHNGLLIDEGCYYGPWMTEIIKELAGHHEPQEEVVFDAIIRRLVASPGPAEPWIIEFGSFWAYYSMWFCTAVPGAHALAMEPDPVYLEVGRRNAELNGLADRIEFVHGAVGENAGQFMEFRTESTGDVVPVLQYDLRSLLDKAGVSAIQLAMVDIQGAETVMLDRAQELLRAGAVRFLVVSTHHQEISSDALTHQRALDVLRDCGAHIIAEHTVRESYSGDGLIAAAFDSADRDVEVAISHARAKESLFGEPEYELAALSTELQEKTRLLAASVSAEVALRAEVDDLRRELDKARAASKRSVTGLIPRSLRGGRGQ
jgi:FkbM family methyltransferase